MGSVLFRIRQTDGARCNFSWTTQEHLIQMPVDDIAQGKHEPYRQVILEKF
jgi:hypothetical protein